MIHSNTILLIGFKHVGKSTVGRALANAFNTVFMDLDTSIEAYYHQQVGEGLGCRQIMQKHGRDDFHQLEHKVFQALITPPHTPLILALGGGTVMYEANRELLRAVPDGVVVYLTAPASEVFRRIMRQGQPAFFDSDQTPEAAFQQLWQQRLPVYQALADIIVENSGSIEKTVEVISVALHRDEGKR